MRILGGIIKNFLLLPHPLRVIIELAIVVIPVLAAWMLLKWIPIIVIKILGVLNKLLTMINRQLICVIGKKNKNVYDWDEKIGKLGRKIDDSFNNSVNSLKKSNWRQILKNKKCIYILIIVYFLAIFPSLPLKHIINEYYFEHLSGISKVFGHFDKWLGEKAEDYPPLFKWDKKKEVSKEVKESEQPHTEIEEKQSILQLNQDTSYAYIRETPERTGKELGVVGKEDIMIYQNEYFHDNERYWLKVIVESQNDLEGWISSKVIESSIIDALNLQ